MVSDAIGLWEMRVRSNAWIKRLALDLAYPKKASTWSRVNRPECRQTRVIHSACWGVKPRGLSNFSRPFR